MSEVEKKEKQNINNIKALYGLYKEKKMHGLFHEVKRVKFDAYNLAKKFKEEVKNLRRLEEEKEKLESLQTEKVKEDREKESFAELFAKSNSKETSSETLEKKEETQPQQPVEVQKTQEKVVEQKVDKTPKEKPQKVKPQANNSTQYVPQRPYVPKYQNDQNKGFKRTSQPYSQANRFQNNSFNKKPGDNRPNYKPNGNNAYRPNQSRFTKPDGNSQNRGLLSIIPKKSTGLESASTAFGEKERNFGNKKKSYDRPSDDDKRINKKSLLRRGLIEERNIEERMVTRKLKIKKPKTESSPVVYAPITNAVITTPNLTVKILSEKIGKPVTEIMKQLMILGVMATINSTIDFQTAEIVASELGVTLELKLEKTFEERLKENALIDDGNNTEKRSPIVTIVGHVDHGKTSLLDYIRKTHVTQGEAGGITQSIGAYMVKWKGEDITFIDTPGHEAFINMRKRGTEITDVAVLIVAGDDGVKPQTIEAIKHIKEAKVPMIVAITKIDKQNVDVERIKQQLTEHEVLPEEWGGDAIIVPISSVTGEGIDKLLETILLVAEMQELKCNRKRNAVGTIIEARLDKNRGPIASIIVRNGTLKIGDSIVSGFALGKVRALIDDKGRNVTKAGPSMPVAILGFDSVPNAGDTIQVVDEKFSKNVIEERKIRMAQEKIENGPANSLDEFLSTPIEEDKKKLNIISKANNQGSAEALRQSLSTIANEEVRVEIVSCGVGNINENDIQLAKVSNAIIVSFATKVMSKISNFAKQNKVEIREYDIIYRAIEDIEKLAKSMMTPKYEEKVVGHAEVRAIFRISSVGVIAGSYVLDGKIQRGAIVKVYREGNVIFESKIASLKREKDEAKEVQSGYECGIKIDNFNDVQVGDVIECIVKEQILN